MGYAPLAVATYYVALFAPRTDVYSQWTDHGWRPVRQELTPQVALDGLMGTGPSISAYMINPGDTSHVLAIDFDTDNGLEQAYEVAKEAHRVNITSYVEPSRRGAHLWVLVDRPVSAKVLRRAAGSLLESALLQAARDPHIEVRPGSDTVDAEVVDGEVRGNGLGHAIRMPLMPHPKTGRAYPMHTYEGRSLGATVSTVLLAVEQNDAALLEERGKNWMPFVGALPKTYREMKRYGPDPYEDASASDILRDLWGVQHARPGKAVRCPAHDDRNPSLSILPDDKRAICKTPGCLLNNDDHGRGTYELTTLAPQAVGA